MMLFSYDWWRKFCEKTSDLSEPQVIPDVINESEIAAISSMVKEVLEKAKVEPSNPVKFWLDGRRIPSADIPSVFNVPKQDENFVQWLDHSYPKQQVALILNNCQLYSENIKSYFGGRLFPLAELHGMPSMGFEITFFLGNYDNTPLGFHVDPEGHQVIHFHLGPAAKEMYIIEPEVYEKQLFHITEGKAGFQDIEKLAPYCSKFTINSGDLFFMPQGKYHIGKSLGLSVGVTVWHRSLDLDELCRIARNQIISLLFPKRIWEDGSNAVIPVDTTSFDDPDFLLGHLKKVVDLDESDLSMSLISLFKRMMVDYKIALYSNNFFNPESILADQEKKEIAIDDYILGRKPYRIFCTRDGEKSVFYMQKRKFTFPYHESLDGVISSINSFEKVKVKDLIAPLLNDWEEEVCLYFLTQLYKRNAIELAGQK